MRERKSVWRNNGLSITLFLLFLGTLVGQSVAGHRFHNSEQRDHGEPEIGYVEYLTSPAFMEATAENWESEFFQMAFYVVLTVFLFQKGSSESKDPEKKEEVDREPDPKRKGAPWPVRKGGLTLHLYKNSLALALFALFLISFAMHAIGGAGDYNEEQRAHGKPGDMTAFAYLRTSRFWFESLQNWQSEFLAVLAIVVLSIWLRQAGSPESKPVDAPHHETGE
jgi:hypothetical protein